jgi:hypothetical protein
MNSAARTISPKNLTSDTKRQLRNEHDPSLSMRPSAVRSAAMTVATVVDAPDLVTSLGQPGAALDACMATAS